jgi:hypothetical protein
VKSILGTRILIPIIIHGEIFAQLNLFQLRMVRINKKPRSLANEAERQPNDVAVPPVM